MLLQIHEPGQTPLPHASEKHSALGIDLGTTHSLIALADEKGHVHVLAQTPSIVSYTETDTLVGKGEIASSKRLMGRGADDAVFNLFYEQLTLKEGNPAFKTPQGPKSPVEVAADILRHLKNQAETALDRPVDEVVITVPAHFDDGARSATRHAAQLAGLTTLRLINEPTAAALAYGLDTQNEGIYAIYDWGGGTFDISLLRLEKGVFQVLGTGGDLDLGGDDLDRMLATHLDLPLEHARHLKEHLSTHHQVENFTRENLEALAAPLVDRTLALCEDALQGASLSTSQIQGVVLVGGSTRMPYVKKRVQDFFGHAPYDAINPDEAVVHGAALQAYALTKGSDTLLLDVIPLSLGLETMGGLVEKMIHRNSPIPAQESQEFTTFQDGQTALSLHVVQGEREFAGDCRSLARFELHGIPPLPAGVARIRVHFQVDADGLLQVSATESTTGIHQHVDVKPSYGLSEDQMRQMLLSSQEHGREDMEKRFLQEAKVKAERLLQELTSALERDGQLLETRENQDILKAMEALRATLGTNEKPSIDEAREALENISRPFAEKRMNFAIKMALSGRFLGDIEDSIGNSN